MFEITVQDAKFWKNCIDAIVNLIDEGTLEIGSEGMSLRAMDPSQIAMVSFNAPKKSFAAYNVQGSAKVSLNFDNLSKILGRSRSNESLSLTSEENKLVLQFAGKEGKRSFKVPMLDMPLGHQKEPKVEHEALISMRSGAFKEMLRDATLISSHLSLEANESGFIMEAHGDSADLKLESEKTAEAITSIEVKKQARATFPLQYLEDIVKAAPEDAQLKLNLKTNAPLKLEYSIGEAGITYYLAPRIEVE